MKLPIVAATVALLFISRADAQTADKLPASPSPQVIEVPSGPLLRAAPEFASWSIDFRYTEDSPQGAALGKSSSLAPRLRKIVVTKTSDITREELVEVSGRRAEKWYVGNTQYTLAAGQSAWTESEGSTEANDPNYTRVSPTGFRDLEWVSQQTYVGIVPYGGRKCLLFTPGGRSAINLSEGAANAGSIDALVGKLSMVALVDADTRLPVALRISDELRSFSFGPPPAKQLSLPSNLADMISKGRAARTRLVAPMPKP